MIDFYHIATIGPWDSDRALVNILREWWHPETYTFTLSWSECMITLKDIALLTGLRKNGQPI